MQNLKNNNMKKGTFEGTSTNGSIDEAIANAILEAKEKLKTDLIIWNLESVIGINGGTQLSNMVTISMKANKIKIKKAKVKKVKEAKAVKVKATKEVEPKVEVAKPIIVKAQTTKVNKPKVAPAKKVSTAKKVATKK